MAWRPHCAGCWQRQNRGKGKEEDTGGGEQGEKGRKKLDSKEQGAAPWRLTSQSWGTILSSPNGFGSLKVAVQWRRMRLQGVAVSKRKVRRSAKVLCAGQNDREACVWGNRSTCPRVRPVLAPTLHVWSSYNLTTYRRTGGGNSVSLFFWQMTPWQLEKMLGSLNRFLSYKNKMCWIRQRQTFYILLLNPNESTDKCHPTPTPSVPWLFFLSRNVIYLRGDNSIWHKQTLTSSKCT